MLNSYVNSGKKKFVATTLALAITFSSVGSVSYKLCDSLCLNASAAELEELQNYDARTLIGILDSTYEDLSKLDDDYKYLQKRLTALQKMQSTVEEAKREISMKIDDFRDVVQTAYKESEMETIKKANNNLFGYYLDGTILMQNDGSIDYIVTKVSIGIYHILSEINECESLEEAEEIIEKAENQAYENMDQLTEEYYGSEEELNKQLAEYEENKEKLENQKQQIENNSELMNKIEQYKNEKDLNKRYKVLEEKYKALKEELEQVESEMKTITTQLAEVKSQSQIEDNETGNFGEEYSNLQSEFDKLQSELAEIQDKNSDVYEELSVELFDFLIDRFRDSFRDLYESKGFLVISTKREEIEAAISSMVDEINIKVGTTEGYILDYVVDTTAKELLKVCDCESIIEAEKLIKDIETKSSEDLNMLIQEAFDPDNRETEIETRLKEITQRMNEIKQEAAEN